MEITIQQETSLIVQQAEAQKITTPEEVTIATEFLSRANKTLDALIAEEEKITAPLNQAIKAERARWAVPKKSLKETIELLRTKLSQYQTEQMRIAQDKADKIAERVSKGTLKVETAVRRIDQLDTPEEKVVTENGSLSFRPKQVLTITDLSSIPREYLVPDEDRLLTDLKSGKEIAGAKIDIIQVPVNRR